MLPIPMRCIWCLREPREVAFDESHVLPECLGNRGQVLPPGVVCKDCNSYFGQKIEPVLLGDPLIHAMAVFLSLVDPDDMNVFRDKLFDSQHVPDQPPARDLNLHLDLRNGKFALDVGYTIRGRLSKEYSPRDCALLSRAVHKLAFESLAWSVFVGHCDQSPDLFSPDFTPVRDWARRGQPHGKVRPVLRKPKENISADYSIRCWKFEQGLGIELMLFADWYAVSLTSSHENTLSDLIGWIGPNADERTWCIAEEISAVKNLRPE